MSCYRNVHYQSVLYQNVMDPGPLHLNTDMIQRRAARYILHHHHSTSSVTDMLQTLGWDPYLTEKMMLK